LTLKNAKNVVPSEMAANTTTKQFKC
jgi:hypothetical protein